MQYLAESVRKDFPILEQKIYGKPLIYLDNAATTQLPVQVINKLTEHYTKYNGNVHRGNHYLSEQSTIAMDMARDKVKDFLNVKDTGEIVFTSGATEGINLVAQSFLRYRLKPGDVVLASELEHHSNFVVWQQLCKELGADFQVIPTVDGELDMDALEGMLNENVKFLAVTQVSNVTGTVVDTKKVMEMAHAYDIPVLIDAAQSMRHVVFDMTVFPCDFLCFSGHKMMAPTGTGAVYIRKKWIDEMRPYRFGGGMVDVVTAVDTTFGDLPFRMEAGTPNYSGIIALGEAVDYLRQIGLYRILTYEKKLIMHLENRLAEVPEVHILGNPKERAGAVSFTVDNLHPYDLTSFLDKGGVALRSGHHCAQPIMARFQISSALRASIAFYNTIQELDDFAELLEKTISILKKWS